MQQTQSKPSKIIGVDPGSVVSGLVMVENGRIAFADNMGNGSVFEKIVDLMDSDPGIVIIETVMPYSMRISMQIIETCKFIGQLEWRLKSALIAFQGISRNEVKNWAYNRYPGICIPKIEAKIAKKGFPACDVATRGEIKVNRFGKPMVDRKPSFNYMDDRIIVYCMKAMWGIETPKPGKRNSAGVTRHSWQALAVGSMRLDSRASASNKPLPE